MPPTSYNAARSLTGLWHGQYSYPAASLSPVPFVATLIQTETWLGGSITERADTGLLKGRRLYAAISGRRRGNSISFIKSYEAGSGPYLRVSYDGTLSEDGLEIDGLWTASGWSGRFLMIRSAGVPVSVAKKVSETVR
jgi:hypothetical protein